MNCNDVLSILRYSHYVDGVGDYYQEWRQQEKHDKVRERMAVHEPSATTHEREKGTPLKRSHHCYYQTTALLIDAHKVTRYRTFLGVGLRGSSL